MTKNRSMRIAVLVLALALITCCFVGTTFAKYTSLATGTASVTIAKWDVQVGGVGLHTYTNNVPFTLFDTIKDTNPADTEGGDDDVFEGRIAPGTKGEFALSVQNNSEVNATISVVITADPGNANVPIAWTLNGNACDDFDDLNADIATALASAGGMKAAAPTNLTIGWSWAYDAGVDPADTQLGIDGGTLAYTATITATQVD